jgi:hypothetical protein
VAADGRPCISRRWPDTPQARVSAVPRGSGGAPQSGFALDIVRISMRRSSGTVGRPVRRRLFHLQNSRKPRRCHAMNRLRLDDHQAGSPIGPKHARATPRAAGQHGEAAADNGATAPVLGAGAVTRAPRAEVRRVIARYFEASGSATRNRYHREGAYGRSTTTSTVSTRTNFSARTGGEVGLTRVCSRRRPVRS